MEQCTTLLLVRHGESEGNVQKIITGQLDLPLTDVGRDQARTTGGLLGKRGFAPDMIYTSPLRRASMTAGIIASSLLSGLMPLLAPDLSEKYAAGLQGRSLTDIKSIITPEILESFSVLSSEEKMALALVDGYETGDKAAGRLQQFIDHICNNNRGQTVLAVSHSGIIGNYLVSQQIEPYDGLFGSAQMSNSSYAICQYDAAARLVHYEPYRPDYTAI